MKWLSVNCYLTALLSKFIVPLLMAQELPICLMMARILLGKVLCSHSVDFFKTYLQFCYVEYFSDFLRFRSSFTVGKTAAFHIVNFPKYHCTR